ncbi:terminase gpA endonuclease subunit, partial [Citrobacter freundii]|uniref:terminase gpA endonuclease subunit n=2 Tax=Enterobacteriaceae TaxID=543 RepID=UPI00388DA25A
KGESAVGGKRSPVWPNKRTSARTRRTFRPIIIGVNAAKDSIRSRLHIENSGPGYMHFSVDRDLVYFSQLTAERLVIKESGGQRYSTWELPKGKANEALDCRVYAYAALCGLFHMGLKLNTRASIIEAEPSRVLLEPSTQPVEKPSLQFPGSGVLIQVDGEEKPKARISQRLA